MPLRSVPSRLFTTLLLGGALLPLPAMAELGWMTREQVRQLPPEQRQKVPAWCEGLYYNPALGVPDPAADTIVTMARSQMVPGGLTQLSGDVRIEQPGRMLSADQAQLDQTSGDFLLEGRVRARTPEFAVDAEHMSGNIHARAGTFTQVDYALYAQHARGSASRIEQQGDMVYLDQARYTTCPPDSSGWRLDAGHMALDQATGWGTARNMVLRVRDVPVLYLPWITFPIDDRRKSGLLFPSLTTSDDGGFDFAQPIYLNLHPQLDATLAPRHIQNRGTGLDAEFRYLTGLGRGTLSYGRIESDRQFNNDSRVIAGYQHHGQINRWTLDADVNYVSDDFYFKDLDTGLDVRSQTNLPREGTAQYWGRTWSFLGRVQAWQTIDPMLPDANKPYRRLPQLAVSGDPTLVGPLKMLWMSDFTRFDRSTSLPLDNITGDRLHLQPALTMPLRTSWGYVEPRARVYHTRYQLDGVDTLPSDRPTRDMWGISMDSGLFFERDLAFRDNDWVQTLEPRLFYNRIDYQDQSDLPDFDSGELTFGYNSLFRENRYTGYDRIGDEEKVSVGLTSRLLNSDSGREALRLRMGQSYYLEDRQVQLDNRPVDRRDWSPMVADATWYFKRYWHLFAETQWDRENDRREQNSIRLGYSDGERRVVHVGYRYRAQENIEQTELAGFWPVHRNWNVIGRWLYDIKDERSLENLVGVEYHDCCWQLRLVSIRTLSDRKGDGRLLADRNLQLQIQMIGLGGFGGKIEKLLERSIPGYGRTYADED